MLEVVCGLFVLAVLCGFAWAIHHAPPEIEAEGPDGNSYPALDSYYSDLSGNKVSITGFRGTGFECIIDNEDGTLNLGTGESPHEAFTDATGSAPYLMAM